MKKRGKKMKKIIHPTLSNRSIDKLKEIGGSKSKGIEIVLKSSDLKKLKGSETNLISCTIDEESAAVWDKIEKAAKKAKTRPSNLLTTLIELHK